MDEIIKVGLEDIAKCFGIEENLYQKYYQEEILNNPDLVSLTGKRDNDFDWRKETPLGGAGTTLNGCVLYSLVRYYNLVNVLETGVSGGYYSSFILAALNAGKDLDISILTSLEISSDLNEVGKLVPLKLKNQHWDLKTGKSSLEYFKKPELIHHLYCHDSLHTMSHMLKELSEFKKCNFDRFFVFIDDEKSDNFWQRCIDTGAFKKPEYDVKYISGNESRLQGHLGGFIKYERQNQHTLTSV